MKRGVLVGLGVPFAALGIFAACEDSSTDTPAFDAGTFDGTAIDSGQTNPGQNDSGSGGADADSGAAADALTDATDTDGADAQATTGALRFDGVDDNVTIAPADGGPSETAFSVELWFKTTTTAGPMFTVYGTGGGADRMLFTQAGKVCFYVYGPAVTVCSTIATYNDGAWHHAAATLGVVGGQRVLVDGVVAGTDAKTASTFTGGNRISIGYGPIAFNGPSIRYAGDIDEVRMWMVERTEAEIASNRNVVLPGSTAGLQDYWRFNESGDAGTTHDEVLDPHDGVLSGFNFTPTSGWTGPGAL